MDFDREIVTVYHTLHKTASVYCQDERAQDLASEAVTRALEHRDSYDSSRPLLSWCRAIMRNLWINTAVKLENTMTVRMEEYDAVGGDSTDQQTIVGELQAVISEMRLRSVCVDTLMEFASGRSVAEIAESLNLPIGTVKRRIHDGRIMLSKAMS